MEDIYLDKEIEIESIKERLSNLFPELTVFYYDFNRDSPNELDNNNPNHIFFNTSYNKEKLEFGFVISIYGTPEHDYQERALFVAKAFSEFYGLRILVPYTNPYKPDEPYFDIVFENGKIFLADDCGTSFGDDSKGLVKILEEYPLKDIQFNKRAEIIKT
jgi:hypothetical protein